MNDNIPYIIILVIATIAAILIEMILLPRIIFLAKEKKLYDIPDARKLHAHPIPRLGGISFMPVTLIVTMLSIFFRGKFGLWEGYFISSLPEILLLFCGVFIIYMVGVYDDLIGVNFKKKFLAQILASFFITGSGVYIHNFYGLFGIHEIPDIIGIILSVGVIVFTTNAINLIDGADGLASGLSAIAFLVFGILFCMNEMWTYATIAFVILGFLIPFFYYNFFSRRKKIFMGDTGSLTLGYILAFMMLRLFNCENTLAFSGSGFILLVFSALFIPLYDALRVMVIRILAKKSPFSPDRNHIHHVLIDMNFSRKTSVGIIILAGIILFITESMLLLYFHPNVVLLINVFFAIIICAVTVKLAKINAASEIRNSKLQSQQ